MNQKLRQVFMLPNFRTHQKEAIDETMAGRDGKLSIRILHSNNSLRAHAHWWREEFDL